MARAYSLDLRERVVSAASVQPCRAVAALFGVSVASVGEVVATRTSERQRGR